MIVRKAFFYISILFATAVYSQKEVYTVDQVSSLPGSENFSCEKLDKKKCFENILTRYFNNSRIYPETEYQNNIEGRVYTQFEISRKGKLTNVKSRSTNKAFKKEVERTLKHLEIGKPAYIDGKPVNMVFSMPFYFRLNPINTNHTFLGNFDTPPIFPGCENKNEITSCFIEMLQKLIRNNFNYPPQASNKGIQGTVEILLDIDIDGSIKNLKLNYPHKLLANEAIRIIALLPKFKPALKNGNPVKVSLSFPITFKIVQKTF